MKKKVQKYIDSLNDIEGKKVIITGCNTGIGYQVANVLLLKKAHVVMACRNLEKAENAKSKLLEMHEGAKIDIMHFDQASLELIEEACKEIVEKHSDFYALVLNAGVMCPGENKWYKDNVPLTIGTNFIGPLYILTCLKPFLDSVKDDKRIIVHGSAASWFNKYKNIDKDLLDNSVNQLRQYNISKLGSTNVFLYFLKENKNEHVKYMLAEPGAVKSDIFRTVTLWYKKIIHSTIVLLNFSVLEGGLPICTLVCNDEKNGSYIKPRDFFTLRGKPKHFKMRKHAFNPQMIEDGYKVIDILKGNK